MARKLVDAKRFLAVLPLPLHGALREIAGEYAQRNGGQVNLNREIVRAIFAATKHRLSAADRAKVEGWLR